jgi:formate/nitrite transporter FocA (FNT family)
MDEPRRQEKKEEEILDRTAPPGEVIYEAIYSEGEHELKRNGLELALSGFAAGLSMGFSMLAQAFLQIHLPTAGWTPLLTKLGYSLGFLIVILGRQQLFTENTLTVILPLLRKKKLHMLLNVGRLWGIVLAMNLLGTFLFALFVGKTALFSGEVHGAFTEMAQPIVHLGFGVVLLRGILAGWLIALMIWLLPFAESARIWVIIVLTYMIGIAELPHVIAGSVEVFYLVVIGVLPFSGFLGSFFVPALIGNIIGGVALVAVGAHAEFFEAEKKG